MGKASYIIGIDLGTTNTTLSYMKIPKGKGEAAVIEKLLIPQVTAQGVQGESFTLPSYLYFPLEEEKNSKAAAIDWAPERPYCVGSFAKERGAELPERMVASAKSWLCHDGVNRREKLLPAAAFLEGEAQAWISPVEVCAHLLLHLSEAWDRAMPKTPFAEQKVFVTVPASFDPGARQLVEEACSLASYPDVVLLEEPQAAFYAWLNSQGDSWREKLSVGEQILVIDMGGGTTDFSLIKAGSEEGDLSLERIAVGDHLLLGGDNMDYALAYLAKSKMEDQGHTIDDWQMHKLIHSCRTAKEQLLGDKVLESVGVSIAGRGSKLVGKTIATTLEKDEVEKLLLDGFVPVVKSSEQAKDTHRSGLQQIGLPYVQDPRVTSQLAKFLAMAGEGAFLVPTAVLFNGGALKGKQIRQRLLDVLNSWAEEYDCPEIRELPDSDYDYAVSRGAVAYGLAREGYAIRIKGGTSRSYYIGVESTAPAVPGISPPMTAVCVVPFGMEEGSQQKLEGREFALALGDLATFRFFARTAPKLSDGSETVVGTVVKNWSQELVELHPVETVLDRDVDDGKTIKVKLTSCVTELGVLELWCEAADGRRWKLEFNVREKEQIEDLALC